ncbi:MAG: efflux RND transporter periplasmic adaptor subunit [Polyangia bacterium]
MSDLMLPHETTPAGTPDPARTRPRTFVQGLLIGAIAAALLTAGALLLRWPHAVPPPPAFTASQKEVVLASGAVQPIPFETAEAVLGPRLPLPPLTARVAAVESRTGPIFAPLDGRIDHAVVRLGEHLAAGARLALIRSGDLAGMLRELRASAAHAQTKRALAERMKLLVEARGASANDLLVAQNDLRDAELSARAADSRLKSLAIASEGDNLYWLLAPRPGVVIQIDSVPGQQVGPGKEKPVATIADLDEVLVLADVPQQDVSGLQLGDAVDIRSPGDGTDLGEGQIETLAQFVDPERQTVPIRILAKNPDGRLRPNAFVEARFYPAATAKATVLRVPTDAVVSDGLQSVVFVQTAPGRFRRTEVTVGRQRDGVTEIRGGLTAGERVVSRGALLLLNALSVED